MPRHTHDSHAVARERGTGIALHTPIIADAAPRHTALETPICAAGCLHHANLCLQEFGGSTHACGVCAHCRTAAAARAHHGEVAAAINADQTGGAGKSPSKKRQAAAGTKGGGATAPAAVAAKPAATAPLAEQRQSLREVYNIDGHYISHNRQYIGGHPPVSAANPGGSPSESAAGGSNEAQPAADAADSADVTHRFSSCCGYNPYAR